MIDLFKQFLKFTVFGLAIVAFFAWYLRGDESLDAANWVGYWIVTPALIGVVLVLFDALWDWLATKLVRKAKGQWPKP